MSTAPAAAPVPSVKIPAGTTAGRGGPRGRPADHRPAGRRRRPRRPRPAARPGLGARRGPTDAEPVPADTEDGRSVIRHSAAHVLAQAVQQAFPDAKLGIGPPIKDGFYYDFDVDRPFTPEDLADLDKRMRKIIKSGQRFSRRVVDSVDDAKAELATEPYKLELVDLKSEVAERPRRDAEESVEVGAGELTIYDNLHAHTGERVWGDLCRGPHVPTTRYIPAFQLTRTAAAYWRGNEKNPQLQRIYGTAWESPEALDAHLRAGSPRPSGATTAGSAPSSTCSRFPDEIGSGLAVFHPQAAASCATSWRTTPGSGTSRRATRFVNTPHITKAELFQISGHLD